MFRIAGLPGWQRPFGWPAWGAGAAPPPVAETHEQQLAALKQQAGDVRRMLTDIEHRIRELEPGDVCASSTE